MTDPQQPYRSDPNPPTAPNPYGPTGASSVPPPPPTRKPSPLTSKPVIGIAALVVGLIIGASAGAGGKPAAVNGAGPAPTVTVTAYASSEPTTESSAEPSEEPSSEPSDDATEAPSDTDTSYKWGQKVGFMYEDVEISVRVDAPKASSNMFDKDNLEAKLTVCNKGSDTIDEMSAEGLGLYAEDKKGGQYDLYGPYRSPEFPVYSYDGAKLKAGKCRTGWVSFEDARKAVRIATEVDDSTYTWSKSGR